MFLQRLRFSRRDWWWFGTLLAIFVVWWIDSLIDRYGNIEYFVRTFVLT